MPSINKLNMQGEVVGTVELNDSVFAIEPNNQAMFDAVMVYQANSRQATAKTKKRDEVSGGGKKPWRQKGTGRARQGSTRSPQWRHGGIVFGPTGEQNYKIKMNKKVRDLALKSALTLKLADKEITVVENWKLDGFKTKDAVASLNKLNVTGKTLIVFTEESVNEEGYVSTFNIPNVALAYSDTVHVYDLLNCKNIIFTEEAIKEIEEVLLNGKN